MKAIKGFTPVEFVAKKRGKESTEFAQELYNKNLGLDRYDLTQSIIHKTFVLRIPHGFGAQPEDGAFLLLFP
ncbi:hypothetical protein AGMMS49942_29880 [Spirochaetia bacterium]|nr:hypothetical protein AGMMS49942_29880 [Spirochaetia bacterium]